MSASSPQKTNASTTAAPKPQETYLRASKVAEILDISRTSVYDLIRTGELKGVIQVGSRLRVPRRAVDELIERRAIA